MPISDKGLTVQAITAKNTFFQSYLFEKQILQLKRAQKAEPKMIYGSSGLEKSLLSYSDSKLIKNLFKTLTQQF